MIQPIQEPGELPETPFIQPQVKGVFAADGILVDVLGLEYRPQQSRMADAVANAFTESEPLLFEAGTGVGKSLAYLIPGLLMSVLTKRPFIVSTATIALQQQLLEKDLPLCRSLFRAHPQYKHAVDFKVAMLVGRQNYLCPPRLDQAIATKTELFPSQEQEELIRIAEWAAVTKTGLREELNPAPMPEVWEWVNADSSLSSAKTPECFYQKARAQLKEAHVIIVNHALLFSLIHAGAAPQGDTPGILFPNDLVVLDEAHRVPDIATDHSGAGVSRIGLDRALKSLYHPKRKKGLLSKFGNRHDCEAVLKCIDHSNTFFNDIRNRLLTQKDTVRLHEPDWTEPLLQGPLKEITERLGSVANQLDSEAARSEVQDKRKRIIGYASAITECLSLSDDEHVYWLERSGSKGQNVLLRSAPIDIAPHLEHHLFRRGTGLALTSATLTTGGEMHHFRDRVGAWNAEAEVVDSPFDYENNMKVYIAGDMPELAGGSRLDIDYMAEHIQRWALHEEGGTLVLFNSFYDLREVHTRIEKSLTDEGRPVFAQGAGASRTELTQDFAEAGNGILLGTDSFWTGIDIPGPALSQVIITRLPFSHPGHPIMEARAEWLQSQSKNPFIYMTLPDAVIKFRQGVGRLIRKQDDSGRIIILDSRILRKEYGKQFIAALPNPEYKIYNSRSTR